MKTTISPVLKETEKASVIDTSKLSAGKRAALETAEAAREESDNESFAASLFTGKPDWSAIIPFPKTSLEDEDQGNAFLDRLETFLTEVDPDTIDRDGEIPDTVMKGLAQLGAFGIKIPTVYGGLGFSQTNYSRVAMKLGGFCANLTALLSAHQSIGVPQPLLMFGTAAQKEKYLPRCAKGEISAFALTEHDVGSDPARMKTTATPSEDGAHFLINGEKLWCTNSLKAGLLVVMARTPHSDSAQNSARTPITAFIVEADSPGVEIIHRCRFMGLKALYNGVVRFTNVKVPRENIILGEGKGLRVALSTLNIGRITLPAACAGLARRCVAISERWCAEREQWGGPLYQHAAIADKLARMKAHTFALESLVFYISSLVDQKKDVRLEAAIAKLWGSEISWKIMDDTMQLRGGRGYETADSLRERGERPDPVERFFRDARINAIFEGSSEIMRLFIAREALDPHLKAGAPLIDSRLAFKDRAKSAGGALRFYAALLPKMLLPTPLGSTTTDNPYAREIRLINRRSRQLARSMMKALARFGPQLDRQQLVLSRLVDTSAELLALSAALARATCLRRTMTSHQTTEIDTTVRYLGLLTEEKTRELLQGLTRRTDAAGYRFIQETMRTAPSLESFTESALRPNQTRAEGARAPQSS